MPRSYHIDELHNGLHIKVDRPTSLRLRLLFAGFAGVFAAFFIRIALSSGWWWFPTSVAVSLVTLFAAREQKAELTASKFELVARGPLGRRTTRRTVCMADIRWLEFQEAALGLAGVYAITAHDQHCVLPLVGYEEGAEIVRRIEATFPGLAETWLDNLRSARR